MLGRQTHNEIQSNVWTRRRQNGEGTKQPSRRRITRLGLGTDRTREYKTASATGQGRPPKPLMDGGQSSPNTRMCDEPGGMTPVENRGINGLGDKQSTYWTFSKNRDMSKSPLYLPFDSPDHSLYHTTIGQNSLRGRAVLWRTQLTRKRIRLSILRARFVRNGKV